ncbi:hypothetical protein NE237_021314 [Protea cynaroides]|uniref:Uncharacterized protein n=1 Tax=Protea cynaroides TaxID=273540 RepID=A0A9Q0HCY0_9MAGN|nr:hypothetical protein NE237_021314 [Protea cynaroides]
MEDLSACRPSGDAKLSCCSRSIRGCNPSWKNPSGEWHVGCKLVYELFTDNLTSPLKFGPWRFELTISSSAVWESSFSAILGRRLLIILWVLFPTKGVVKLKDQVTNSEKWFTTSEIEGSITLKLNLSLKKPVIMMPR